MDTEISTKEHFKAKLGLGKLLLGLANNVFAELRTKHRYNKKITKLEKERDKKLSEIKGKQEDLKKQIFSIAKNKEQVFPPGTKSVTYAIGRVGFRKIAAAVEIANGFTEKDVIGKFMRRHRKYLSFTPKLNRKAILSDYHARKWETLSGINIKEGEEFFISLAPRGEQTPETITVYSGNSE